MGSPVALRTNTFGRLLVPLKLRKLLQRRLCSPERTLHSIADEVHFESASAIMPKPEIQRLQQLVANLEQCEQKLV
ncbi:hypothetical protein FQN57_003151 [Myotisia sp. PD_48]|nr:hypothetical protein FQN57_003151 [Myotisia sp. PD_48]